MADAQGPHYFFFTGMSGWGAGNLPVWVKEWKDIGRSTPVHGWSQTPMPCKKTEDGSYHVDAKFADSKDRKLVDYSWDLPSNEFVLPGEVPTEYDLFICHVRRADHGADRDKYSDYQVFKNGLVNEALWGTCGWMIGMNEAMKIKGGDLRVYTIFIDHDTELEKVLDLLPEERHQARHQAIMLYAWPATQSRPETWQGMFNARGIYHILHDAPNRGLLNLWPGMDPKLYKLMSSKCYIPMMAGKNDVFNVAPTVTITREAFLADPTGVAQWAVGEVGEKVMVKRGNTWGSTGTHPAKGAQKIEDTLKMCFEVEDEAEQVFVQQIFPNVTGEMRSFRISEGENNVVHRTIFMCEEDGRENDEETGAGLTAQFTMVREKAIDKMFFGRKDLLEEAVRRLEEIGAASDQFCREYCGQVPSDYRVDVLIAITKHEGGDMTLDMTLCELTEMGASMCGTNPNARFAGIWQRALQTKPPPPGNPSCISHHCPIFNPANYLHDRYTKKP